MITTFIPWRLYWSISYIRLSINILFHQTKKQEDKIKDYKIGRHLFYIVNKFIQDSLFCKRIVNSAFAITQYGYTIVSCPQPQHWNPLEALGLDLSTPFHAPVHADHDFPTCPLHSVLISSLSHSNITVVLLRLSFLCVIEINKEELV